MPQLKEDEWPKDNQPTTEEHQVGDDDRPPARVTPPREYPPKLPSGALPTKD